MKTLANVLISIILAAWIVLIAVFSIQNVADVSPRFLAWESVTMPVGVVLTFCVATGTILGAIVPLFFMGPRRNWQSLPPEDDFDFDE